jgi:hypothetical protein
MGLFTHKLERVSRTIFEKYTKQLTDLIDKKHGVYALYDEDELYYVGKAIDLKRRVGQHLKDRHLALWTHFSLFLTTKSTYIDEIESILITLASPKGNRVRPRGNVDNKLKSALEKLIREQQKLELGYILGEKKRKATRIARSRVRPKLEGFFSKSRPLTRTYKGKDYSATLLKNGKIKFKNKIYDSPTAAAKAIVTRSTVNGWGFWYVKDEDGDWVKLSRLK